MQRRLFTRGAVGALAALGLRAHAQDADAPVVGANKIVEALSDKDIVLDRQGQPGSPGSAARRDLSINLQVQFTFDSAQLLPQGKRQLDELAMALSHRTLSSWGFVLAGHTDRVGDADYNLRLSHARAEAVKAYLEQVHGVAGRRLQTIGYGFSRLLDPSNPAAAINRRVEVRRVVMGQVERGPDRAQPATGGRLVTTPQ